MNNILISINHCFGPRKLWLGLLATVMLVGMSMPAAAAIRFFGSGVNAETGSANQSAQADFSLVGDTLTLTLVNTTGVTAEQGDALTGVLFDLAVPASLKLESISLATGSDLWLSQTTVNDSQNLAGSWTDVLASPPRLAASYGLATTGFAGEFNGGTISQGNASPNYGIVGPDTFPANRIGGSQYPFVQKALTFKIKLSPGALTMADISNVRFLFGTSGAGWITASTAIAVPDDIVPEPGGLMLVMIAIAAAWLVRRRAARPLVSVSRHEAVDSCRKLWRPHA